MPTPQVKKEYLGRYGEWLSDGYNAVSVSFNKMTFEEIRAFLDSMEEKHGKGLSIEIYYGPESSKWSVLCRTRMETTAEATHREQIEAKQQQKITDRELKQYKELHKKYGKALKELGDK